jgi:uncharacterized zinc-type alcohol dehydrogenase-like protein
MITTSANKAADARALGATHVLVSTDAAAMKAAAGTFDYIYDTIPRRHDLNPYLTLLGRNAVLALVGAVEMMEPFHSGLLLPQRSRDRGFDVRGCSCHAGNARFLRRARHPAALRNDPHGPGQPGV